MMRHMLTTVDNPHDPFTEFNAWFGFDVEKGYHTPVVLAQASFVSDELSDVEISEELERAIDEIVNNNFLGLYRKVSKEFE